MNADARHRQYIVNDVLHLKYNHMICGPKMNPYHRLELVSSAKNISMRNDRIKKIPS